MTDADESLRRLFVPAARARDASLEIEARGMTPGGYVIASGLRRVSVVERMERVGAITHRQGAAARQLHDDWLIGIMNARNHDAASGSGGTVGYLDHQLDAATRYRMVHDRLGPRLWPLTYSVVCDDVSVPDYARHRGLNRASVQAILRVALDMVGDVLGTHE